MMVFTFEEMEIVHCYMNENRNKTIMEMSNAIPYLKGDIRKLVIQTKEKLEKITNLEYEQLHEQIINKEE